MFCPNCGANNSTEQKFCRSCGLNLEQTALSLLEQVPSAESAAILKKERALEKFGSVAFTGLGIAMLLGVMGLLYVILTKMVLAGSSPLAGALLMVVIVFATLTLAYVFMNESLKERKSKLSPELLKELEDKRTTGNLLEEGNIEPVPSVTERTTELLYSRKKTKEL